MEETSNVQFTAYNNFIKVPSPQNALDFVISCHKYITILASKWREPGMTRKNKINEIISEMYLILLEDFSAGKSVTCKSAFAYLDSKLKRLVNPANKHFFSDLSEVSPSLLAGRDQLTFEKVNMIKEIVKIIRNNVVDNYSNNGLLLFLFIHIYPQIRWISELLSKNENIPFESRYEADLKRISRFNNNLRLEFNKLANGDWRDILNWNQAERSHLAWKIINIAPAEVESNTSEDLTLIDNWRENFDLHASQSLDKLSSAKKVYSSLIKCFQKSGNQLRVEEERDFWGKPPDIISQLIGDFYNHEGTVQENIAEYTLFDSIEESAESNAEKDLEFMEVARELNKWFGTLLAERNKKSAEKIINW